VGKAMNQTLSVFEGVVTQVSFRNEVGNRTQTIDHGAYANTTWGTNCEVLTFRLEITDQYGDTVETKVIEMRGEKILGVICNGDIVEVIGVETRTGIRDPQRVFNLKSKTEIIATPISEPPVGCGQVFLVIFLSFAVVLVFYPFIISIGAGSSHSFIVLVRLIVIGLVAYLAYKLINKNKERY
jgi:RsiW-degrading membrane proteinase PrsW (M82 family)